MPDDRQKRVLEILLVMGVWMIAFSAVVGPMIDATLPGRQPSSFADDDKYEVRGGLPDTVRGWGAIITGVPVLIAYLYLRRRFTGEAASE